MYVFMNAIKSTCGSSIDITVVAFAAFMACRNYCNYKMTTCDVHILGIRCFYGNTSNLQQSGGTSRSRKFPLTKL